MTSCDGVGGKADAQGVADALGQEHRHRGHRADGAGVQRARFGDAEVLGDVADGAEAAAGLDHLVRLAALEADHHVLEADRREHLEFVEGALHQGAGGVDHAQVAVALVQAAAVDADADGHAAVLRRAGHLLHVLAAADVAGVDAQLGHAGREGGEGHLVVEVDVGHDRHVRFAHDAGHRGGGRVVVHGHAHQVGAGGGQLADLLQRGLGVAGAGAGHRLHAHGRVAADGDVADLHLAGLAPRGAGGLPDVVGHVCAVASRRGPGRRTSPSRRV